MIRKYQVRCKHRTPMLHHWDNIEWADRMMAWQKVPANKAASKAGDDRTPPWRWFGSLYRNFDRVAWPVDNLMSALMRGGAKTPTGKGTGSFKSQTQSGIIPTEPYCRFTNHGKEIVVTNLLREIEALSWEAQNALVADLGFMLDVRRVKIGKARHIRVRPRFDEWEIETTLSVTDDAISRDVLTLIGEQTGQYVGLGDWRPGSPTPGSWGMFSFEVE